MFISLNDLRLRLRSTTFLIHLFRLELTVYYVHRNSSLTLKRLVWILVSHGTFFIYGTYYIYTQIISTIFFFFTFEQSVYFHATIFIVYWFFVVSEFGEPKTSRIRHFIYPFIIYHKNDLLNWLWAHLNILTDSKFPNDLTTERKDPNMNTIKILVQRVMRLAVK